MLRPLLLLALFAFLFAAAGCSMFAVEGPRIWWDDQQRKRLPNDYTLPEKPPAYEGEEKLGPDESVKSKAATREEKKQDEWYADEMAKQRREWAESGAEVN